MNQNHGWKTIWRRTFGCRVWMDVCQSVHQEGDRAAGFGLIIHWSIREEGSWTAGFNSDDQRFVHEERSQAVGFTRMLAESWGWPEGFRQKSFAVLQVELESDWDGQGRMESTCYSVWQREMKHRAWVEGYSGSWTNGRSSHREETSGLGWSIWHHS